MGWEGECSEPHNGPEGWIDSVKFSYEAGDKTGDLIELCTHSKFSITRFVDDSLKCLGNMSVIPKYNTDEYNEES